MKRVETTHRSARLLGAIAATILLVIGFSRPAVSADDGGRPGAFLDYAASARSMGMGQAFTAIADDASAVYFNPSGVAFIRRQNIAAQFSTLLEDSTIGFFGYARPLQRRAGLAIGLVNLGSGDISRRDDSGNKTGTYSTSSNAAFLSGAFSLDHRLALGTTMKVVRESVADDSDVGLGLDLSAMYRAGKDFRLGLMGRNLVSPSLKLDEEAQDFPRSVTLGVAYKPSNPLTIGLDIQQQESSSVRARLGADYLISDLLSLRGGVNDSEFSLGLGVGIGDWGFDYALGYSRASSDVRDLGSFHRFGVQFNFGMPVPRPTWGERVSRPAPATVVVESDSDDEKPTSRRAIGKKSKPAKVEKPKAVAKAKPAVPPAAVPVPAVAPKEKPKKDDLAQDALRNLGERMDTWDGIPTAEIQREVDQVNRYVRKGEYLKPEDIYAAQGYVSFFLGEYSRSVRSLDQALDADPKNAALARRADRARKQMSQLEKPVEPRRRGESTEIKAVRERYEAGDWNGTIVLAQRLLETSPKDQEAIEYQKKALDRLVQPRLREAKDMLDSDRFVESFIMYQKVLDFDPDNAEATAYSNRVVKVIEKKSDMEASARGLSRSDTALQQGLALFAKGLRLYAHGNVEGARNAWENAILHVKSHPLVYDTVRSTLVELGQGRRN